MVVIEQASDNPRAGRPRVQDYLEAFEGLRLFCLRQYPIRRGRWWLLYFIRYGLIPPAFFPIIAKHEILHLRSRKGPISYYEDYLFVLTET